jgi:hypothetical protein
MIELETIVYELETIVYYIILHVFKYIRSTFASDNIRIHIFIHFENMETDVGRALSDLFPALAA